MEVLGTLLKVKPPPPSLPTLTLTFSLTALGGNVHGVCKSLLQCGPTCWWILLVCRVHQSQRDRKSVNLNCPHAYKHTRPRAWSTCGLSWTQLLVALNNYRVTFCLSLHLKCFPIKRCSSCTSHMSQLAGNLTHHLAKIRVGFFRQLNVRSSVGCLRAVLLPE